MVAVPAAVTAFGRPAACRLAFVWLMLVGSAYSASVRVSPASVAACEGWYTVNWHSIPKPGLSDVIAIYKDGADINTAHPIKYVYASQVSTASFMLGLGRARFWLPNYRTALKAVYIKGKPFVIGNMTEAASVVLPNTVPGLPCAGRLSIAAPGTVRVTWQTGAPTPNAQVRLGTISGVLTTVFTSVEVDSYNSDMMCGEPAKSKGFLAPGAINTVLVTGLAPNTRYFYQYGAPATGFSREASFLSAPTTGPGSSVKLLMVADHGRYAPDNAFVRGPQDGQIYEALGISLPPGSPQWTLVQGAALFLGGQVTQSAAVLTRNWLLGRAGAVHGLIFNGDIAYAQGELALWDDWLQQMSPVLTQVPTAYAAGNHEVNSPGLYEDAFQGFSDDSGGECGVPYTKLLRPPQLDSVRLWYSFNMGPIHFATINTDQKLDAGSEQRSWLEADLAAVDRNITPWVVINLHRPLYNDETADEPTGSFTVSKRLRDSLEVLLARYSVDMTWSGHVHLYHRTCPVYKNKCVGYHPDGTAKAPVHMIVGNAGFMSPLVDMYEQRPPWMDVEAFAYGGMEVEANSTHLTVTAIQAKKTQAFDTLTLRKPLGWQPMQPSGNLPIYQATPATDLVGNFSTRGVAEMLVGSVLPAALAPLKLPITLAFWAQPVTPAWPIINSAKQSQIYMTPDQTWILSRQVLDFIKLVYRPDTRTEKGRKHAWWIGSMGRLLSGRLRLNGPLPCGNCIVNA